MTDTQATAPATEALISMEAAASYLDVPYSSLAANWRKWGIVSYKVGRGRKFRPSELETWLKSRAA